MKIKCYQDYRRIYHLYSAVSLLKCGISSFIATLRAANSFGREEKLTILTFSIFPELTRVWYYFMEKVYQYLKNNGVTAKLLIVDCNGSLKKAYFPKAEVIKFINHTHPVKLDFFLKKIIGSEIVWVTDDDCFIFDLSVALDYINKMADEKVAAYSFYPRPDWFFDFEGGKIRPMGSYCFLIKRKMLEKENLSFNVLTKINPHNGRHYDTADYMNEVLLKRGYKINLPEDQKRSAAIGGFRGSSIWKALAWGCNKRELEGYLSAPYSYDYNFRHIAKSFYIADKVFELNKILFTDFKKSSLFNGKEIKKYIEAMPENEIKPRILDDFAWVDDSYNEILKIIRK